MPEGIEIFPRQDEIGAHEFGNAIRAPLGVHRGAKESRGWRFWFYNADYTLRDQLAYLARIRKLTETELQGFIAGKTIPPEFVQQRQATRDADAVFHVSTDGVPHSRLRRGEAAGRAEFRREVPILCAQQSRSEW